MGTVVLMGQAPGSHEKSEALRWLRLSADQGYAPALNNLAVILATGEEGESDTAESIRLLTKAAELNLPDALFALATSHLRGTPPHVLDRSLVGTFPLDQELATDYLVRAATQWHLDSLILLGMQNLEHDTSTAAVYFRVAASKGCLAAGPLLQVALARLDIEELMAFDRRTREWTTAHPDTKGHSHANAAIQGACLMPVVDMLNPSGTPADHLQTEQT